MPSGSGRGRRLESKSMRIGLGNESRLVGHLSVCAPMPSNRLAGSSERLAVVIGTFAVASRWILCLRPESVAFPGILSEAAHLEAVAGFCLRWVANGYITIACFWPAHCHASCWATWSAPQCCALGASEPFASQTARIAQRKRRAIARSKEAQR